MDTLFLKIVNMQYYRCILADFCSYSFACGFEESTQVDQCFALGYRGCQIDLSIHN